ncbi:PRD domain-containing protein [Streptococcus sp. zg-86]|uniref:PRD domain-containing protein n=1 Tax=Streptococcus zhangguiae TaxID=2664091 RepID=A0A6I4RJU3_9STRE|nr:MULTISPECIES: BglG family transcription antiterminator [unclassified Streptococcus]MTB64756.1 PRD domain-containing protein [Streptococcus sp. zg-86]MTB91328.1 PRD domain-containing protein [Streptococcus sp. zg-36]MWV56741.1 PRD domain-containing protein [Streptococcus sp. zg-70]QTH48473.1 transcription antiterminator [Streptococcus sp. zg-86]
MPIFDFQRLDNILNLLIEKNKPIPIDELSSYCNVSDRTIRSDIHMINDYIVEQGATITLIRKEGYIIEYTDKEAFESFWKNQDSGTFLFTTSDSRLRYLIRIFLTSEDYISQDYLQSILFVSQNTLYNDFRSLKQSISPYHLKIVNKSNLGYILTGLEQDKRTAIINLILKENISEYIIGTSQIERDICMNIDYDVFSTVFQQFFSQFIQSSSDYFYRNLFTRLLLSISRIKYGHSIIEFHQHIQLNRDTQLIIREFIHHIEQLFSLKISSEEQQYIEFSVAENFPHLIDNQSTDENQFLAKNIVSLISQTLKELTNSDWYLDNQLQNNLLEHIKLFLNIQTISGQRSNPILKTIKNNFPYAFELAINCSQVIIKKYKVHFSEDEISYIALHLANAMERYAEKTQKLLSLAIICGSGKTFSSIIESKIKRKFPNTFTKIYKFSYMNFQNEQDPSSFDIVVSTVPIKQLHKNILFIDINDLETAMQQIEDKVLIISKSTQPTTLFAKERFLHLKTKSSKEEVLEQLHHILLEQHLVTTHFLSEIYEREKISSTIIGDTIAIPHPLGDSVITSNIFPVIAPKGITWDSKNIKFVFLFAIKPEDSENIQDIYDKILDFINSEKAQANLIKRPSFELLLDYFTT